jgi:hypothetical protein
MSLEKIEDAKPSIQPIQLMVQYHDGVQSQSILGFYLSGQGFTFPDTVMGLLKIPEGQLLVAISTLRSYHASLHSTGDQDT